MTDQDRLLRQLITTFFVDFIDLFFPKMAIAISEESIQFLQQTPIDQTPLPEDCILVKVVLRTQPACFWIQFENPQATGMPLERRIFHRFAQLDAAYQLPIYPIIVFSSEPEVQAGSNVHRVDFLDRKVLDFHFVTLKLAQLNWRDYPKMRNPVAAGLMATMNIQPTERPVVKAECLRSLAQLKLDAQRQQVVSKLIEHNLHLNATEEQVFQTQIERMGLLEREQVMEILASSDAQTLAQGVKQEALSLVQRLLNRRFGDLSPDLTNWISQLSVAHIEDLGEALLELHTEDELRDWLAQHPPSQS